MRCRALDSALGLRSGTCSIRVPAPIGVYGSVRRTDGRTQLRDLEIPYLASDERSLALIVGFVEREPLKNSVPFLRSIGPGTGARGHFHAAVFPYRPLPKGNINLRETISGLLATESAKTVLHLLADEREFEGVGQTDLMRGACWVGPLRILKRGAAILSITP